MPEPTPPLAAETEALREAYAALNRNDIPAMVREFDPQIRWSEPAHRGGTVQGLAGVEARLAQARATWAEGTCEPERFMVVGHRIIVFLHVRVRLEHDLQWVEGRLADVYTFRDGKAVEMRSFDDPRQAVEWAGGRAPDAS